MPRFGTRSSPNYRPSGRSITPNMGLQFPIPVVIPNMLPELEIRMTPIAPFAAELEALPRGMQNTILRLAVRSAMAPLRRQAKSLIRAETAKSPYSSDLLAKNLIIRVHRNKNGLDVTGLVGARRKVKKPVRVLTYVPAKKRGGGDRFQSRIVMRSPSRYLHLFEKGFRHWWGFQVKGRNVLRRTITTGRSMAVFEFQASLARNVPLYVQRRFARVFGITIPVP